MKQLKRKNIFQILIISSVLLFFVTPIQDANSVGTTFPYSAKNLNDSEGTASENIDIAVSENNIYVVYSDIESSGDTAIYFTNSTDNGKNFGTPKILDASPTENIDPNGPQIAISGTNIYVTWEEEDPTDTDTDTFVAVNTNNGDNNSWTITNLSSSLNSATSEKPQISVNGTNIYVVWRDLANDSSGDIYFVNSTNSGTSFHSPKLLTINSNTDAPNDPQIASYGNNVYVIWNNGTSPTNVYFAGSINNGKDFAGSLILDANSTDTKGLQKLSVSGNTIHTAWRELTSNDVFYRKVTDNGDGTFTRTPSSVVTVRDGSNAASELDIASSGSNVHMVWRETVSVPDRDIFFANSTDAGTTFSSVTNISSDSTFSRDPQLVVSGDNVYVAWTNEESTTDKDIFLVSSFSTSGAKFGSVNPVTSHTKDASFASIAALGSNIYIAYEDDSDDTGTFPDVFFINGTTSSIDISFNQTEFRLTETARVEVTAPNSNSNNSIVENITVTVTSTEDSGGIQITASETTASSGIFRGVLIFGSSTNDSTDQLKANAGSTITASFSTKTGTAKIFSRSVVFNAGTYNLDGTARITVTDQNANTNSGSAQTVTVTVTSTNAESSGSNPVTLTLAETGINTGIFGGATDAALKFMNGYDAFPLDRDITITHESTSANTNVNAVDTTTVTVTSDTEPGNISITVTETGINTNVFKGVIKFITAGSSGNSIQASAGDFISISGSLVANGQIESSGSSSKKALKTSVSGAASDTITASYQGKTATATVEFAGGESGGGGGGLVRPTVVLNAIAGAQAVFGGGDDRTPPITTLRDITKSKISNVPEHIQKIVENQKLDIPIKPLINEPYDLPLAINEKKYPLGDIENRIETDKLQVGVPVKLKMLFYEQNDLEHVSIYMNLRDNLRSDQSDTFIIYEKRESMKIVDRNGFFESVNFEIIEGEDNKKFAIFEIIFAKPMETSDLVYKTWDFDRRGTAIKVHEAIKVENPATEKTTVKQIEETPKEKPTVPTWIKSNAKWWADGQIDDKTFTNGIGFLISEKIIDVQAGPNVSEIKDDSAEIIEEPKKETNVPQWVKSNAKWWAEDLIDEETFLAGIEYLVKQEIITVT